MREKASLAMTSLTLSDAGKQFAIKANAVEGLCPLLDDENWKVRANAAGSMADCSVYIECACVFVTEYSTVCNCIMAYNLRIPQIAH